jgi:hypothetical protein
MRRKTLVTTMAGPNGADVVIIAVPDRAISSRWIADRVINAFRARTSLSLMSLDAVVIDRGTEPPAIFGSSPQVEAFFRARSRQLEAWKWVSMTLDW